jgi:hypothetical protein
MGVIRISAIGIRNMVTRQVNRMAPAEIGPVEKFFIVIMPTTMWGADTEPLDDFTVRVGQLVDESRIECELSAIAFFIRVLPESIKASKDGSHWNKAKREYRIRRNINLDRWNSLKLSEKKNLLVGLCSDAVQAIPTSRLNDKSKKAIIDIFFQAIGGKTKPRASPPSD